MLHAKICGAETVTELDPRLNAFRPDLADARLEWSHLAQRYAEAAPAQCVTAVADLRRAPRPDSPVDTQILYGETVDVFETVEGWCWVQAQDDKYVGYVADTALTSRLIFPTHIITAPRTFLYPGPDMKLPAEAALSIGSRIAVAGQAETRGTQYLTLANGGAVIASHADPLGRNSAIRCQSPSASSRRPICGAAARGMGLTVPASFRCLTPSAASICSATQACSATMRAGRLIKARTLSAATWFSGAAMSP